jgi:hypothetical protein
LRIWRPPPIKVARSRMPRIPAQGSPTAGKPRTSSRTVRTRRPGSLQVSARCSLPRSGGRRL